MGVRGKPRRRAAKSGPGGAASDVVAVSPIDAVPAPALVLGGVFGLEGGATLARVGAAVALLADVISYSLQAQALDRISGRLFSVLASTEPAVGALFGLVALGQHIRLVQWLGVVAVVAASTGASLG